jgi:hypothetical protein
VTRSHNFVFDPSPAIGKFGNEIGKSGERIQRIRYFELASYMMKSFACFLGRATFRGATFRWLDGVSPYRQIDVQLPIDEQKRFPAFHQLTAKLACNR